MPISGDDERFEFGAMQTSLVHHQSQQLPDTLITATDAARTAAAPHSMGGLSKAELRKTHKPIMEKRRRARINHCLNEIKTLILEAMNKDPARHSKLEKADILEMAVKHLQNVQRQQLAFAVSSDTSVLRRFKTGFNECANEIDRYVNHLDGVSEPLKERIRCHLQKCMGGIEHVANLTFPNTSLAGLPILTTTTPTTCHLDTGSLDGGDDNRNADRGAFVGGGNRIEIPAGIPLIPSRLPSGEFALVLPNSNYLQQASQRLSAFATVVPNKSCPDEIVTMSPLTDDTSSTSSNNPHDLTLGTGFKPVACPQVSSSSSGDNTVLKSIKFPIHYADKKASFRLTPSSNNNVQPPPAPVVVEPFSIITNHAERYKQAQMREDSMGLSENRVQAAAMTAKRKFSAANDADGTSNAEIMSNKRLIISNGFKIEPTKILVHDSGVCTNLTLPTALQKSTTAVTSATTSASDEDGNKSSDSMWRPW